MRPHAGKLSMLHREKNKDNRRVGMPKSLSYTKKGCLDMDLKSSIVILLLSNAVSSGTKYTTGFRRQILFGVLKSFFYTSARTKMFQMLD